MKAFFSFQFWKFVFCLKKIFREFFVYYFEDSFFSEQFFSEQFFSEQFYRDTIPFDTIPFNFNKNWVFPYEN